MIIYVFIFIQRLYTILFYPILYSLILYHCVAQICHNIFHSTRMTLTSFSIHSHHHPILSVHLSFRSSKPPHDDILRHNVQGYETKLKNFENIIYKV